MEGDWVQAKYYINSTQWTTQAQSVAPLRYCRLDQVDSLKALVKKRVHVVWFESATDWTPTAFLRCASPACSTTLEW